MAEPAPLTVNDDQPSGGPTQFTGTNQGGDSNEAPPQSVSEAVERGMSLSDFEERPAFVPEKFWDAENRTINNSALLQSYQEMEKKMGGGGGDDTPPPPPNEETPEGEETPKTTKKPTPSLDSDDQEAQSAVEEAGLDYEALTQEYMTSGELSQDTRKQLNDSGIPNQMIDDYIAGQQAKAEQITNTIYESVGGQDTFSQLQKYAQESLSQEARTEINTELQSGDLNRAQRAVDSLYGRWVRETGGPTRSASNRVSGRRADSGPSMQLASEAQVVKAMQDPRYKSDPAYRQQVSEALTHFRHNRS